MPYKMMFPAQLASIVQGRVFGQALSDLLLLLLLLLFSSFMGGMLPLLYISPL